MRLPPHGRECPEEDSNLHNPKVTSPSSWRVCQFRHPGKARRTRVSIFPGHKRVKAALADGLEERPAGGRGGPGDLGFVRRMLLSPGPSSFGGRRFALQLGDPVPQ